MIIISDSKNIRFVYFDYYECRLILLLYQKLHAMRKLCQKFCHRVILCFVCESFVRSNNDVHSSV